MTLFEQMEEVRASGITNMFMRTKVADVAQIKGHDELAAHLRPMGSQEWIAFLSEFGEWLQAQPI